MKLHYTVVDEKGNFMSRITDTDRKHKIERTPEEIAQLTQELTEKLLAVRDGTYYNSSAFPKKE